MPPQVPTRVYLLALFFAIIGSLTLLFGIGGQPFSPSTAVACVFSGVLIIADAIDIWQVKTWAWYLAIAFNLSSLVNNYVLFPDPTTIRIPLELLVLAYLVLRQNIFRV